MKIVNLREGFLLSIGVYKSKSVFFIILITILVGGGFFAKQYYSSYQASADVTNIGQFDSTTKIETTNIEIKKDGQVLVNGKKTNRKMLFIGEDHDLFRYTAYSEEGVYIEGAKINVYLPSGASKKEIKPIAYAVHGVGDNGFFQPTDQEVDFYASDLTPTATYAVTIQLPVGLIDFSFWQRFIYNLANMNVYLWLVVSFVPFFLTLIYLLFMYEKSIKEWQLPKPKDEISDIPDNLAPAEAAVLLEGKITNKVIAAILVDLAGRGYIDIIKKDDSFVFGKKKAMNLEEFHKQKDLKEYERVLLSKIFYENKKTANKEDILFRVSHHVFSRKIAQVYLEIYEQIASKKYFLSDPAKYYKNYRIFGLILFFISFFGLIAGLALAIEPKFYLIFWLMMLFTSFLIIKMAPHLPRRTKSGYKLVIDFLKLKNFLTKQELYSGSSNKIFEKYLPYAMALGVEVEWSKRFLDKPFEAPDWYVSRQPTVMVEDFANGLFPIIGYISQILVTSREPIV